MHADPTYPLLPIFAFLGFVIGLVPLPWHLQAWNAGTCVYMIWASFACLIQFVNSIVWRETALSVAPVWCDISKSSSVWLTWGAWSGKVRTRRPLYRGYCVQRALQAWLCTPLPLYHISGAFARPEADSVRNSHQIHHRSWRWHSRVDAVYQSTPLQDHVCAVSIGNTGGGTWHSLFVHRPDGTHGAAETSRRHRGPLHLGWVACVGYDFACVLVRHVSAIPLTPLVRRLCRTGTSV